MKTIVFLLCLLASAGVRADEAPGKDDGYDQMQEFMRQENERIKAIKILHLDLERSNLELKKKEIEIKMADLNKNQSPSLPVNPAPGSFQPLMMKLSGIFVRGDQREALMEVDGSHVQVRAGGRLRDGITVKKIDSDQVVLEYTDGKQQIFTLGS